MRQLIPDDAFDGGKNKFLEILGDPARKAQLVTQMRNKIHARGPMGLRELTTYKYLIYGNGQLRE